MILFRIGSLPWRIITWIDELIDDFVTGFREGYDSIGKRK